MTGDRITKLYAFTTIDPIDNNEGIIAFSGPDGLMMPMIGADMTRVECLKPIADEIAAAQGFKYEIKYFQITGGLVSASNLN